MICAQTMTSLAREHASFRRARAPSSSAHKSSFDFLVLDRGFELVRASPSRASVPRASRAFVGWRRERYRIFLRLSELFDF